MQTVATKNEYYRILAAAIIASFVISFLKVYNDTLVNDDAVLYLTIADHMLAGEWEHALSFFHRPFYPMLIYAASFVTGLDTISAAHIVNALLASALVYAFLYTFYHLGASGRLLMVAAVLVLFFPTFVKYKTMIIREHGFLAGLFFSIGNILLYARYRKHRYLALAIVSLLFASLFRFEAMVYAGALPLVAYVAYTDKRPSLKTVLVLMGIFIVAGLVALYLWLGWGSEGPVSDRLSGIINSKLGYFFSKADIVADQVLEKYNRGEARAFMLAGLLSILLISIIERITIVYGAIAIYGYPKLVTFLGSKGFRCWQLFVGIAMITLLGILMVYHIALGRYAIAISGILLIPAIYGLYHLLFINQSAGKHIKLAVTAVTVLFLLVHTVQKISSGDEKVHIRQAADWIRNNIDNSEIIASNDSKLLYYSGHSYFNKTRNGLIAGTSEVNPWSKANQASYLAITRKSTKKSVTDVPAIVSTSRLVHQVSSDRGSVSIYKLK